MFHPHSNTSHNWFFSGPCYILSWSLQLFRRVGLCRGGFLFCLNILVVCLLENVSLNNWWSLDSLSRDQKCSLLSSLPLYGFHHGVYLRSSSLSLVSVFKLSARWFCLVSKKKMTTVNRSDQPFLKAHQSAECLTPSYKLKIINNTLRLCDSPHKQTDFSNFQLHCLQTRLKKMWEKYAGHSHTRLWVRSGWSAVLAKLLKNSN